MFTPEHLFELVKMGWMTNVPLLLGSMFTIGIFFERLWIFRGLEAASRDVASRVIDRLVARDLAGARQICEGDKTPAAAMMLVGLRWENVDLDDLDRIFATERAELATGLRRGIWVIGTVGSLAPFVGLFGTVIGIIRAFADMAEHGAGGFAIVANGIAEALVATAAGLGVAIIALMLFNYLQIRVQGLSAVYARVSERLVQALLYVESTSGAAGGQASD
jgi:biopolymer transport protein ExbB